MKSSVSWRIAKISQFYIQTVNIKFMVMRIRFELARRRFKWRSVSELTNRNVAISQWLTRSPLKVCWQSSSDIHLNHIVTDWESCGWYQFQIYFASWIIHAIQIRVKHFTQNISIKQTKKWISLRLRSVESNKPSVNGLTKSSAIVCLQLISSRLSLAWISGR